MILLSHLLQLAAVPFYVAWAVLWALPVGALRHWWRWQALPVAERRRRIAAARQAEQDRQDRIERRVAMVRTRKAEVQALLAAHGLADTEANRRAIAKLKGWQ